MGLTGLTTLTTLTGLTGLTAQVPRIAGVRSLRAVEAGSRQLEGRAGELWERYGDSAYALACALVGNETSAADAVRLAMADLARWAADGVPDEEAWILLARSVYRHAPEPGGTPVAGGRLPRQMVWLSRLARLQRASLALCVYGGLTHREAAALLDVPPATVADLLTAGLRELGRLAAADGATCA